MSITGPKFAVEGQRVTLVCTFSPTPREAIQWNKDDLVINDKQLDSVEIVNNIKHGVLTSELKINTVAPENGGTYWCSPNMQKHSVAVLPAGHDILNLTKSDLRKTLTLACNASLASGSSVQWFYHDSENPARHVSPFGVDIASNNSYGVIDRDTNELTIDSFMPRQGGKYTCKSESDGTDIKVYSVLVKPYVQKLDKSKNVMEGDSATVKCLATGYPLPTITWYYYREGDEEGRVAVVPNDRMTLKDAENGIKNGTLTISKLTQDDRAFYTCRAVSRAFGQEQYDETTIMIRVKDRLAAVWPFLGICAEVAVLCTIIFIYEKRRGKKSAQELDDDNEARTELNKNASDHKEANDELRQRKA